MPTDDIPTDGVLIVDAANVVGSVPDGWWRDRAGAAARLRDRLAAAVDAGTFPAGVEIVLVVEGAARDIGVTGGVRLTRARASGDDAIAAEARDAHSAGRPATVVTADRGLRARVAGSGARVVGPRTLRTWLDAHPDHQPESGRGGR